MLDLIPSRHLKRGTTSEQLDALVGIHEAMMRDEWDCDLLTMCALLQSPMAHVVGLVLRKYDAAATLGVSETVITNLLDALEAVRALFRLARARDSSPTAVSLTAHPAHHVDALSQGYPARNPYHNATHAADVAYTTHLMLKRGCAEALGLTPLQCVTAILAATAHDYKHPGIGANFLIAAQDDLALRYNGGPLPPHLNRHRRRRRRALFIDAPFPLFTHERARAVRAPACKRELHEPRRSRPIASRSPPRADRSPLESMHVSEFFLLIKRRPECDVFAGLPSKERAEMRALCIEMVLATDMKVHFEFLTKFQASFQTPHDSIANDASRSFAMAMLLHCADISNPAKPQAAYFDWTDRVVAEFYAQGDREQAAGVPISMFYDRTTANLPKMQTGFINYIVRPLFQAWCTFVPELEAHCMAHIERNFAVWLETAEVAPVENGQLFIDPSKLDWDWDSCSWRR